MQDITGNSTGKSLRRERVDQGTKEGQQELLTAGVLGVDSPLGIKVTSFWLSLRKKREYIGLTVQTAMRCLLIPSPFSVR